MAVERIDELNVKILKLLSEHNILPVDTGCYLIALGETINEQMKELCKKIVER